jgi:glycosyltransferase involved in cell wall biosynthesis
VKKRVLQLVGSFNQGGSEQQALALTRSLEKEGSFEVFAATLNKNGVLGREFGAIGLAEIPEFPLTSFYNPNFVRQVRRCIKYLRENKIGLVHTHDFYTNVFGMTAATVAGVPVRIASKRETGGMRSGAQDLVESVAFGRAHAIVANSRAVHDHLTGGGIAAAKIRIVYNGTASTGPQASRSQTASHLVPSINKNSRLITLVANLRHPVKNVPMLMRAAKRVIEHDAGVHFVIAGEGELRNELEGLAVRLGVARNLHFIGRCDDIPALLAASYACILTSTAEGFSNSLIEYMAAGKPVVATNVGGAAEAIVDGETGYLVPSDDDAALAGRLIELLDDPQKVEVMGNAGRKIASEKFSQEAQLQKTIDLYNALLNTN